MTKAKEIIRKMESMHDEAQRNILMRFFKTGPGQYGDDGAGWATAANAGFGPD